jgi:hypothetical protein
MGDFVLRTQVRQLAFLFLGFLPASAVITMEPPPFAISGIHTASGVPLAKKSQMWRNSLSEPTS